MAVLKQTSPTAWPSAPRPKPSSTVPSASTRSAVGLWSGQAASFSAVVMRPLHSRANGRRQSTKLRIHMHFRGIVVAGKRSLTIRISSKCRPALLQRLHFAAIFEKNHACIERRLLVVAGDAELFLALLQAWLTTALTRRCSRPDLRVFRAQISPNARPLPPAAKMRAAP